MRFLWALFLSLCLLVPVRAEDPVHFADPNLKDAVEQQLWLADPTPGDMMQMTQLYAGGRRIRDLTGLECATSLTYLNLSYNRISDASILVQLGNLETLIVNNNALVDVSPLSGLAHLEHLDVHDNDIRDIAPLSGLGHLETLVLRNNAISDISVLSGLTGLRHLDMYGCEIADISPLSGLTAMEELDLEYNHLTDLSALAALTNLHRLALRGNQIADISPLSELRDLQFLDLHDNSVSDVSALLKMNNLKTLYLGSNYELNERAYGSHLQTIVEQNPFVSLTYEPNTRPPVGISASQGTSPDALAVRWDRVSNGPQYTSYYQVVRAVGADVFNRTPVSDWQTAERFDDVAVTAGEKYTYWVRTAISSEGIKAGDLSMPAGGWLWDGPVLTVTSTAGGRVETPEEGAHAVEVGRCIDVQAEPVEPDLYFFVGWTGAPVEAGVIADADRARATVIVYQDYTLKANFATWMNEIYVDDDAPDDPGPYAGGISDPQEDGTAGHPFDSIREAIEVAADGASILVRPGTYHECVDFSGKRVQLLGIDANEPNETDYPVIDGAGQGPVVTFVGGEDPN
ncbi:MAG: leucine-rich repeat domain-containing protein, partial [Sedimentisphaerales bacterium]|nr:leucine-rich repeat domain-containing protein [Sedimentisphaerales bacterium]